MAEDTKDPARSEDFSTDVQVAKDGTVTLSQDIQDEQKAAGFVPDVQPKAAGTAVPLNEGDPTKTQATGNVVVQHAANAANEGSGPTPLPKLGSK